MKHIQLGVTRLSDSREVPVGAELVLAARQANMSVSHYLDVINPSKEGDKLDAFQRQLKRFNIRTQDDLAHGIPSSTVNDFFAPRGLDGQPLRDEQWMPEDKEAARFFASSQPQSWALFPEYINRQLRATPLADDVLGELIATTTMTEGNTYQAIYFQDSVTNRTLSVLGEGGELPRVFVRLGFQTVALEKYGVGLEGTYEYSRRIKIPIFNIFLSRIRQQIRLDQAAQAADVLVNGDGNGNAATNYNVSALDSTAPAGPGTVTDPYLTRIGAAATSTITKGLTYAAFLSWRTSLYALGMTTIVGRMNEILQVLQLQMPTINPTLLLGLINPGGNVGMGYGKISLPQTDLWGNAQLVYLPFAPGGLLIGLNKEHALEMLMEQGSDLVETDKDIMSQKNVLAISQVTGFDKILQSASSTLTFA